MAKRDPNKKLKELVKSECANYMHGKCWGVRDCKIMTDSQEDCSYFETAVKPLLYMLPQKPRLR